VDSRHEAFFARPLYCKFVTINADGTPHATPVWFFYERGKFVVTTPVATVKARNVRRNPRVVLLIDDGESYVMVKGTARIAHERSPEADTEKLALRYLREGAARAKAAELLKEAHVSIEVVPERVVSQDV
jgi:PPOX class probable F420-dependent enzyme